MIKKITPANEKEWLELRTKDVTSSEVAALFGISPYITAFELWHRKKDGNVVTIEQNDPMKWGIRLQDSIAHGIAEDNGWNVRRMDEYMRCDELKFGSSFDFCIQTPVFVQPNGEIIKTSMKPGDVTFTHKDAKLEFQEDGILEIKNVHGMVYKDQWLENDDGTVEAPPHIEIQVQHQLAVSGYSYAYIAALIGGNKVVLIKREPDPIVIDAIRQKVREFWISIEANKPPAPDYSADAEFISKLYGYAEVGKVFDASGDKEIIDLALKHKQFTADEKKAKEGKDAVKAQLLMKIGESEKVICDGFSISCGAVAPTRIEAYDRAGFRMFRLNWPKAKKGE